MTTVVTYWILLLPTLLELGIDELFWTRGHSDKPWSTVLRAVVMAGAVVLVAFWMDYAPWYTVAPVTVALHVAAFPYLINWVLGRRWDYLSAGNWYDRMISKMRPRARIVIQLVLLVTVIFILEHFKN